MTNPSHEVIVSYTITVTKAGKDWYFYTVAAQPGGSKMEVQPGPVLEDGTKGPGEALEVNPPVVKSGQALGIGQAMSQANDIAYSITENAGMIK